MVLKPQSLLVLARNTWIVLTSLAAALEAIVGGQNWSVGLLQTQTLFGVWKLNNSRYKQVRHCHPLGVLFCVYGLELHAGSRIVVCVNEMLTD